MKHNLRKKFILVWGENTERTKDEGTQPEKNITLFQKQQNSLHRTE